MSPSVLVPLHGIASRRDLPLPFSYVVTGAALALAPYVGWNAFATALDVAIVRRNP